MLLLCALIVICSTAVAALKQSALHKHTKSAPTQKTMTPAKGSTRRSTVASGKTIERSPSINGRLNDFPESHQSSPRSKKRQMSATDSIAKLTTSEGHPNRRESPKKGRTKAAEVVKKNGEASFSTSSKVEESPSKKKRRSGVAIDEIGEMAGFFDDESKVFYFIVYHLLTTFCFNQVYDPRSNCLQKLSLKGFTSLAMN